MAESSTGKRFRKFNEVGGWIVYRMLTARREGHEDLAEGLRQHVGAVKWAMGMLLEVRDRVSAEEWQEIMEAANERAVMFRMPNRRAQVEVRGDADDFEQTVRLNGAPSAMGMGAGSRIVR